MSIHRHQGNQRRIKRLTFPCQHGDVFAMKRGERRERAQWEKFLDHWGYFLAIPLVFIVDRGLLFFVNLRGRVWVYLALACFALMIRGAAMIARAKIPVYRIGRFLTFGSRAIPAPLAGIYHWGWRLFVAGIALTLCLLLSRR
jgi:hypothetical protein